MKNLDLLQAKRAEIYNRINQATKDGNEEAFAQAFNEFIEFIQQSVLDEAKGIMQANDVSILSGRGVRQLTSQENEYYQAVVGAMKSANPKQALAELEVVMPQTIIDDVMEDLATDHPLLNAINFQNTSGLIEHLVNTNDTQLATWSKLTDPIVKELSSGFKKVNLNVDKLSAFLPVAKAMLDLGPAWIDKYVRALLGEALSMGLEEGIVNGTGKDMPIGMNRQVGEGVTVTDGIYPIKETIKVASLDPVTYGELLSKLCISPSGKTRVIKKVLMAVNPVDYMKKIMPATTIRGADGTYVNNVLPFPTEIVPSVSVPIGKMIVGIAEKYFMAIGTAKSGKMEYSDDYKFLEDERVYLVKLYGHGEPMDNNAFLYCNIDGLQPAAHQVYVANMNNEPLTLFPTYDARLESLKIGSLDLSPTFNKSVFVYTTNTTNATNTVHAIPRDGEAEVEITVNGAAHANTESATWHIGENMVVINITCGTETETYTVTVTKS